MSLISKLKGVFKRMIAPKTVENVLGLTPAISNVMRNNIELWENLYTDKAPWLNDNVSSMGLPAMIASEKARTATIEMEVKITGDSERAKFIEKQFQKVLLNIREQLEYGIALGELVIKPYIKMGADNKYVFEFNYTKATNFYPIAFSSEGAVTEAAFIDRIITKDYIYSKLEYHKLEGNSLIVKNTAYKANSNTGTNFTLNGAEQLGNEIPLTEVSAWAQITPEVKIDNMDTLLFAFFKMPEANNIDLDSPLGVSGFSRAVDLIEDADNQYSNLLWEFEGGQLAVDVDRTALNPMLGPDGQMKEYLPKLQDRLFRRNLDLGEDDTYNVFSPALRDTSILNGLNNILMHIEDVCALSRGTFSVVTYSEARTATELKILKQRSFAANADIQKALEETLRSVIYIMEKYCDLYNIVPQGEMEVAYKWDDSIIVDKDAERQIDLMDVNAGLMSKIEYRKKWYGETEAQAKETLKQINDEKSEAVKIQQQSFLSSAPKNSEQDKKDKMQRANESQEVKNKDDK